MKRPRRSLCRSGAFVLSPTTGRRRRRWRRHWPRRRWRRSPMMMSAPTVVSVRGAGRTSSARGTTHSGPCGATFGRWIRRMMRGGRSVTRRSRGVGASVPSVVRRCLLARRRFLGRSVIVSARGRGECRSAKSDAGESRNQHFHDVLVHIAPTMNYIDSAAA